MNRWGLMSALALAAALLLAGCGGDYVAVPSSTERANGSRKLNT